MPIEITSRRGDAVLLSRGDYDALQETAHLLRGPADAKWLIESLQQALSGQQQEKDRCWGRGPRATRTSLRHHLT
jgi:antitoxin YefM